MYRSPVVKQKIVNEPPRYTLRKKKNSVIIIKEQGNIKTKQQQLLQQAAAKIKRKYDEQQKDHNKKFNTRFKMKDISMLRHRYPTRHSTV